MLWLVTSVLPGVAQGWMPMEGLVCELWIRSSPLAERCLNPLEKQSSQHLVPVYLYCFISHSLVTHSTAAEGDGQTRDGSLQQSISSLQAVSAGLPTACDEARCF